MSLSQFPETFLTNPSKLRIYLCKIPTVITKTLIVVPLQNDLPKSCSHLKVSDDLKTRIFHFTYH